MGPDNHKIGGKLTKAGSKNHNEGKLTFDGSDVATEADHANSTQCFLVYFISVPMVPGLFFRRLHRAGEEGRKSDTSST